jgi:putative addiction module CopG family antidote
MTRTPLCHGIAHCQKLTASQFDNANQTVDNAGMDVTLPVPLEEFVRSKVAAGDFQSADAVVCEGLKLLQLREEWKTDARRKIDEGWNQAKAGELRTPEQVRGNLNTRKENWKK